MKKHPSSPPPRLVWGTRVKAPAARPAPFACCPACGRLWTSRGLRKHWLRCEPTRVARVNVLFALGHKSAQGELPL